MLRFPESAPLTPTAMLALRAALQGNLFEANRFYGFESARSRPQGEHS
jgi:hypothetical protein